MSYEISPHSILTAQESPIKKRRRGRPCSARKPSLDKTASLNSAAVLKAGSPNYRSPVMRVSPTHRDPKYKSLTVNEPTPKGGSLLMLPKRQLTPVTRKLFAVKDQVDQCSTAAPTHTPKSSKLSTRHEIFSCSRKHKLDNPNNSFLVDPNILLSSPVFSTATNDGPQFLSSPITNHKLVDPKYSSSAAKAANSSFNFSSIILSSPIFHGYYLHSTPPSASTNRTVSDQSGHLLRRNPVRLAVKPMVMGQDPPLADSSSDDDTADLPSSKRHKPDANMARKPLLPPVSIANLEFLSSDDDDDVFAARLQHKMPPRSPPRPNSLGLAIDASGKAILALDTASTRHHHRQHRQLLSSPSAMGSGHLSSQPPSQNINEMFGERINLPPLPSSPFINTFEEQQINEILSSSNSIPDLFHPATANRHPVLTTDQTVESDIEDETLLQNCNPCMVSISNNTFPHKLHTLSHHIDQSFDADTSDEAIEPCDARVALMNTLRKQY